jgi:hypothetical protein
MRKIAIIFAPKLHGLKKPNVITDYDFSPDMRAFHPGCFSGRPRVRLVVVEAMKL